MGVEQHSGVIVRCLQCDGQSVAAILGNTKKREKETYEYIWVPSLKTLQYFTSWQAKGVKLVVFPGSSARSELQDCNLVLMCFVTLVMNAGITSDIRILLVWSHSFNIHSEEQSTAPTVHTVLVCQAPWRGCGVRGGLGLLPYSKYFNPPSLQKSTFQSSCAETQSTSCLHWMADSFWHRCELSDICLPGFPSSIRTNPL